MGIGKSRQWFRNLNRKLSASSYQYADPPITKYKRSFFHRKKRNSTKLTTLPLNTQTDFHQSTYGVNVFNGTMSIYTAFPRSSPQYLPMNQNYLPVYSYAPQQPMMMVPPPPMTGAPYIHPSIPISTPYVPQAQVLPNYNNMINPGFMPAGSLGRPNTFPIPYSTPMGRLLTDWTRGGKISPGFLGPPI